MREVGDGFDLMVGVLALVIMLTVGAWSLFTIRNNMEVQVDEKMVAHNLYGQEVQKPMQTAKDALMSLVVNDAYVPEPSTVVFQLGRETYTVVFNNDYFQDKDASINKAWRDFFWNKMNTTIESITLQWLLHVHTYKRFGGRMVPSGNTEDPVRLCSWR